MTEPQRNYRSGYVGVMGRPNVGKSTLINTIIGQKITAVSPKPQTTRKSQLGILTRPDSQVIFVDTPGLHNPHHKLGEYMNQNAIDVLEDVDLILVIVDGSEPLPHEEDHILVDLLNEMETQPVVIMAINKIDLVDLETQNERQKNYQSLLPEAATITISATRGDNLDALVSLIMDNLKGGEPYYPEDQITDLYEREIVADLIRAAGMLHLRDEVPHALAVRIDEYTERGDSGAYIAATLFVERDSQKGIVIGKGGEMLKQIGKTARFEIESVTGRQVFLQLRVKVRTNWRNDEHALRRFGY